MRIVGYTRVSTREQAEEGLSLGTQRAAIETECVRRGWELVEVIVDDGYTGTNEDRPGYARLVQIMAKRKRPDAVVVARLDRLTRSLRELATLMERADKRWGLVALDMDLNTTTANGQLVMHIIGAVSHWESRMNSERTSAGMKAAHERAKGSGHKLGFQRRVDDVTVRRIVRARDNGQPFNKIAARLDRQGVPTPGGGARWYPSTVARVYDAATKAAS